MREIKFRAWEIESDKWVTHNVAVDCDGMRYWVFGLCLNPLDREKYTLEQFTGLRDKTGKEIYEGDIVRAYTYLDEEDRSSDDFKICVISWGGESTSYPAFDLDPNPVDECNGLQYFAAVQPENEKIEVIGNIHENPELLK